MTSIYVHAKNAILLAAASAMAAAVGLAAPCVAFAQDSARERINIPASNLEDALKEISIRTGVRVDFDPDAVVGVRSKAVMNAPTARAAVVEAITGSGLAARVNADGSISVFQAEAAQKGDIVVIAQRDEAETNYRVNKTTTSDRSGGTLRELPQNTAVVSDKLLRDQQAQTIADAVRSVAGATQSPNVGQGLGSFSVRGFTVAPVVNGTGQTADSSKSGATVQPLANVERVEVLKGPAAILAGQGNLGGTINIVTKKPMAYPLLILTGEYQSGDSFKGIIDASNALVESKVLSARIIAEAQKQDRSYGGYNGREEYLFAPSLRFKNATTDIIVGVSTSKQHTPAPYTTVINTIGNGPMAVGELIDRPRSPIGRESGGLTSKNTRYTLDASQNVGSWLDLSLRGEHYDQTVDLKPVTPLAQVAYGTLIYFNSHQSDRSKGNSVDGYARLKFDTFGVSHKLVAGFNYTDLAIRHFDALSGAPIAINVLDPLHRIAEPNALGTSPSFTIDYDEQGAYVQDLIEYDRFHFSIGYRWNWYHAFTQIGTRRPTDEKAKSGVPAFGLVVDITPELSVFGNFSRGYLPTTALAADGSDLPDIKSSNREVGLKADLFGKRASLVLSLFETKQDNRLVTDVSNPAFQTSIPGGQRARGVDATLTGQILPYLNLNATYAYTKFEFANPQAAAAVGLVKVNAQPAHSYSLFAAYERPQFPIGGALGIYGRSSSYVTSAEPFYKVPGGAQIDGNIFVKMGSARLNVGVQNIFDKRLYLPTTSVLSVPIADGRRVTATLSYRFF